MSYEVRKSAAETENNEANPKNKKIKVSTRYIFLITCFFIKLWFGHSE